MRYLMARFDLPRELRHPMQEFVRTTEAVRRLELLAWHLLEGEEIEHALFYVEGDLDPYREAIENVESIPWYDLTPVGESSFHAYVRQETRAADERWRTAFAHRELVVVPPITYDGEGVMSCTVVGNQADLQALLDGLPAAVNVTVERLGEYDRRHGTIAEGMTDRQFEVLAAAVRLGYYETPRSATLEDVAAAVGCAPSTASDHLRKTESRVLRRLVTDRA
jgi:predicted DNA binding protein